MLILLPPSESKAAPGRGTPLDLATLSRPALTATRREVLDALVNLCRGDEEKARQVLGLSPGLADAVERNAGLPDAPAAPAGRVYTGVLYDALALSSLSTAAKRRAASRIGIVSGLFGVVRVGDRIPAYRLAGDVRLPGLGTVAGAWREPLTATLEPEARTRLVLDLRSGMYAGFWRPSDRARVVRLRVLAEQNGERRVVSHFNKATKGRVVRSLLEDGRDPRTAAALVDVLTDLGWQVEPTPRGAAGRDYDVIVTEV